MAERYTAMEKLAIVAARTQLWDALVKCGKVRVKTNDMPDDLPGAHYEDIEISSAFASLSGEQIDSIISTIWEGLRASMQIQSARGEIPF